MPRTGKQNQPTFTGWSGYPTHLVVCDRDGMTVRAADHRDNTSGEMDLDSRGYIDG
jgi:hypothetical protein